MDLSGKQFDLRESAETGAWCQLVHPVTGIPLGVAEGKPCRILIKGVDSRGFDMAIAKTVALRQGEMARRTPGMSEEQLNQTALQNEQTQARELADISVAWENLEYGKKPIDNKAMAQEVYASYKWIREQLLAFIGVRANYAGNGSAP